MRVLQMFSKRCELIIVDDHEVVRRGLQQLVADHDELMCVGWAADGEEAIELACKVKPHVVVMETELAHCRGLVVSKELATRLPGTGVVAFSTPRTAMAVVAALSAGVKAYVSKGSPSSVLVEGILAAAVGKYFVDPSLANPVILDLLSSHAVDNTTLVLSGREREVLTAVAMGFTSGDIAGKIGLSMKTVESYKARACAKLGLRDRPAIVSFALASGWMNDMIEEFSEEHCA